MNFFMMIYVSRYIKNDIYKEYNSYNIDTSLHKPFIYLGFKIDLSIKYDEFYETDLGLIKNKLSTLIEG